MLILGGTGRLYGGLIGAAVYMVARDQFSGINPQYWYFWIGLLLIAVVMLLPNGILGGLTHSGAAHEGCVVSANALATHGLNKSFGSLVVASDIELVLPHGVRYALIGPNGAGKTTLINLMTGMLQPDGGRIFLGDDDITALPPEQRVRLGLVRTFQINTLFPHLTALESVTLAVCERRKVARTWWRQLTAYRDEIDEAYDILATLGLAPVCHRLTRELAYGQQRLVEIALALATKPKVLLLDEPAAGVPREESRELLAAIAGLSRDITVLFIEHDMDLVFRFASRIIVMVGGRVLVEGTPPKSPPTRGCARSISARRATRRCRDGTAACTQRRPRRLRLVDRARRRLVRPAGARRARRARQQRRRQIDAASHHHGLHPGRPRPRICGAARTSPSARRIAAPRPASAGWRRNARFFRR